MNDEFKVVYEFKSPGEEIIALDVYLNSPSKIMVNNQEEHEHIVVDNQKLKEIYIKVGDKNTKLSLQDDVKVENEVEKEVFNQDYISITLLDINGLVSVWENYTVTKMFSMYDLSEIPTEIKEKEFFSMGYNYYIKTNKDYYVISTDFAVYIIKKILAF